MVSNPIEERKRTTNFCSPHMRVLGTFAFLICCCFQQSGGAFQKCGAGQFSCPASQWKQNILSYPDGWYSNPDFMAAFGISASYGPISAAEYIANYMPCCQYCVWSLYYPKAVPIVFAISPSQDTCQIANLASATMSACYLDCTQWPVDYSILDKNGDSKLSNAEFSQYIINPAFAPPMLYYLYTGMRQAYSSSFSALDSNIVMLTSDLNKDSFLSLNEWLAFRHFVGPILTTRSGPYMTSSDGRPLAEGPLAGFFMDSALNQIWQSKIIFMLLDYYVSHSGLGFESLNLREPTASEAVSVFQQDDLDGSGRISFEEHYFRLFADSSGNGQVDVNEYYASLYRATCSSICPQNACSCTACAPSSTVAASCSSIADTAATSRNFALHDIDQDGGVNFMERKFIAADTNQDLSLSWDEWRVADFPTVYGPWQGSLSCTGSASGGNCVSVDTVGYKNYMAYHYCSMQSMLLYTTFSSPYPLLGACTVVLKVRRDDPFVMAVNASGAEAANLTLQGWLCFNPDGVDPGPPACYDGFGVQLMQLVANRLGWSLRPVLSEGRGPLLQQVGPPVLAPGGGGARHLELALVTSLQATRDSEQAGVDASSLQCSQSLTSQDGLVVVKRSALTGVIIEMSIFAMVISAPFVNFVTFCFFAVIVGGHIFWFLERKTNPQFDRGYLMGVIDGSWFAMVTVATVGYGDKVPITLTGKSATVIWMFFGILAFGVFCRGDVRGGGDQGVTDLRTLTVGVPAFLTSTNTLPAHFSLGKEFGFEEVQCGTLQACADSLLNHDVAAIIAPLPDILSYFVKSGLSQAACGNPLIIAGNTFSINSLGPPMIEVCGYSQSVHITSYLTDAITTTVAAMQSDGTAGALEKQYLSSAAGQPSIEQLSSPLCAPATLFRITQLIAFGVVFGFYVTVNITARIVRKRLADQRVKQHLETALLDDSDAAARGAAIGGLNGGSEAAASKGGAGAGGSAGDETGSNASGIKGSGARAELVFGDPVRTVNFGKDGVLREAAGLSDAAAAGVAGALEEEVEASKEAAAAALAANLARDPVAGLVRRISRIQRLQVESLGELTEQVRVGQEAISRVAVVCGWILVPIMALVAALAVSLLFLWVYNSRFVYL